MIIGLCGKKNSGKSSIATFLCDEHGYMRANFATPIYLMEETYLRYCRVSEEKIQELIYGPAKDTEIVPELGYQTSRYFQQTLGTEWGRNIMHECFWTQALARTGILDNKNIVFENVRFQNEAHIIRRRDGYIIRVTRPNGDDYDQHPSETELERIRPDSIIINDHTKESMYTKLLSIINMINLSQEQS